MILNNELYFLHIWSYVTNFYLLTQLGILVVLGIMIIGIFENDSFEINIVTHVNVSGELSFFEETFRGTGITMRNTSMCIIFIL